MITDQARRERVVLKKAIKLYRELQWDLAPFSSENELKASGEFNPACVEDLLRECQRLTLLLFTYKTNRVTHATPTVMLNRLATLNNKPDLTHNEHQIT